MKLETKLLGLLEALVLEPLSPHLDLVLGAVAVRPLSRAQWSKIFHMPLPTVEALRTTGPERTRSPPTELVWHLLNLILVGLGLGQQCCPSR